MRIKKVSLFSSIKLPTLNLPNYYWVMLVVLLAFNGLFWLGGLELHPLERTGYMVFRVTLDMIVAGFAFMGTVVRNEVTGKPSRPKPTGYYNR